MRIYCPKCKSRMNVRTSERPSKTTVKAQLFCSNCYCRATFTGGIDKIFVPKFDEVQPHHFDRPESENQAEEPEDQSKLDKLNTGYL